jgi:peptidoglycan biosynthesis protein MviN/MurJ (putative lipid II flippase)
LGHSIPSLVTRSEPGGTHRAPSARFAFLVAAGIFLSRIFGLVRDRVFAHYFGNSDAADVFRAAFRIPNFLQNLFGEGVLSALSSRFTQTWWQRKTTQKHAALPAR